MCLFRPGQSFKLYDFRNFQFHRASLDKPVLQPLQIELSLFRSISVSPYCPRLNYFPLDIRDWPKYMNDNDALQSFDFEGFLRLFPGSNSFLPKIKVNTDVLSSWLSRGAVSRFAEQWK